METTSPKPSLEEELTTTASHWANLMEQGEMKYKEMEAARRDLETLKTKMEKAEKKLMGHTGQNIPERNVRLKSGEVVQITPKRVRLLPEILTEC